VEQIISGPAGEATILQRNLVNSDLVERLIPNGATGSTLIMMSGFELNTTMSYAGWQARVGFK